MQNGPTTTQGARPNRPTGSYAARSKRWPSNGARPELDELAKRAKKL